MDNNYTQQLEDILEQLDKDYNKLNDIFNSDNEPPDDIENLKASVFINTAKVEMLENIENPEYQNLYDNFDKDNWSQLSQMIVEPCDTTENIIDSAIRMVTEIMAEDITPKENFETEVGEFEGEFN